MKHKTIIISLLLGLVTPLVYGQSSTITIGVSNGIAGKSVAVPIDLTSTKNVFSYQVHLEFDDTILHLDNPPVSQGTAPNAPLIQWQSGNPSDEAAFGGFNFDLTPIGDGTIAWVNFMVDGAAPLGKTFLRVKTGLLFNNPEITYDDFTVEQPNFNTDGGVDVIVAPTATPTPTPTVTPTATATPTFTPTPLFTYTPTPTPTMTFTPTSTPTVTPIPEYGDVVINEIAWAGTAASSLDEWVELYNNTSRPVDLTNWIVELNDGDNQPMEIVLNGIIEARGFYLIESIDDQVVSNVAADAVLGDDLELADSGMILELRTNDILVDVANQLGPWYTDERQFTMERIDTQLPGTDPENWHENDPTIARNGIDADGNPIYGTPRKLNSAAYDLNFLELEVSASSDGDMRFSPGEQVVLSWRVFTDKWNYTNAPVAVYLGAIIAPSVDDRAGVLHEVFSGGPLFLFNGRLQPKRYNPAQVIPTFVPVAFPPVQDRGEIVFTAPGGVGQDVVFAAAFINLNTQDFVRTDAPIEFGNRFNLMP